MVSHGDDIYKYKDIRLNFSSNVYNGFDHSGLFSYLGSKMNSIMNYPEPEPYALEVLLAEHLGIEADEVMATNGATEAIYLIAQAYRGLRSRINVPTFAEYEEACRMHGHEIVENGPDVNWLCNPNNPTGKTIEKDVLKKLIIENEKEIFVIDQSYDRFSVKDALTPSEIVAFDNVFVLHSMTKDYAIPGLRLGYVVANSRLIENLRQLRMPWSVNNLAIEAGKYLLKHDEDYKIDARALVAECERVAALIENLGTVDVSDSDTHILLCRLRKGTAAELKEKLAREHGILIRDASNFKGLSTQHFRVAIQTQNENDELVKALRTVTRSKD